MYPGSVPYFEGERSASVVSVLKRYRYTVAPHKFKIALEEIPFQEATACPTIIDC